MLSLQNQKKLLVFASVICLVCLVLVQKNSFKTRLHYAFHSNSSLGDGFISSRTNASDAELGSGPKNSSITIKLKKVATKNNLNITGNVTLIVIISTAPERSQRRERIRKTYWKHCYNDSEVRCFFVTDGKVSSNVSKQLQEENRRYGDMVFQPLAGGREFGLRFLHQIRWASANYNFEYFLRADDDYFICLSRLIHELKHRPKENLVWANFHCDGQNLVWPDEAWMVFTRDIIHRFLGQNKTEMFCHPHADQQIALWLNNIPSKLYFHDPRLHHHPPAAQMAQFAGIKNICDKYMGLHGAYQDKMIEYHKASNDGRKNDVPKIRNFHNYCSHNTRFAWDKIGGRYRFEPKLCGEKPDWLLGHDSWKGGEAGQWRRRR